MLLLDLTHLRENEMGLMEELSPLFVFHSAFVCLIYSSNCNVYILTALVYA